MPLSSVQNYETISFETTVNVFAVGALQSASDLAPLIDELNRHYGWVTLTVASGEPPAAGMTEIAVAVAVIGPAVYLRKFLETWATEDAKALRAHLYRIIHEARSNSTGRGYIPFKVEIGGARFYFYQRITEEQLQERLAAAQRLVETLPDSVMEGSLGPGEYGYFWSEDEAGWKGTAYELNEPIHLPPDLYT